MTDRRATNVLEGLESEELPFNGNVGYPNRWMDCTQFLDNVCSGLDLGEMLHHKTKFSLLEVMSCIEMMDPKMDSSFNTPRVRSVQERYADGTLPPFEDLSLRQIIYTMDRILAGEMLWYEGFALPQTVFSCLYLHDDLKYLTVTKDTPKTSIFLLFTKALFRRVDEVSDLIFKTECRTEEEFVNNAFGLMNVKKIEPANEIFTHLTRMEVDLSDRLKGKKVFAPLQQDSKKENFYIEALLSRIRFQRLLSRVHSLLNDPHKADLIQAAKSVKLASEELKIIQRQHAELFKTEEPELSIGFDPKITIRVSSATVMKPIETISFLETSKLLNKYLEHLEFICDAKRNCTSFSSCLKFFNDFATIPNVTVVARSRLMLIAVSDRKIFGTSVRDMVYKHVTTELPMLNENHKQLLKNVMSGKEFVEPLDEEEQLRRDCDDWMEMMTTCFINTLNTLCFNTPTIRRKIAHMIPEWAIVEQRAEMIDLACIDELREQKKKGEEVKVAGKEQFFALTYFCIELTMDAMYKYLMLGFDFQLYHRTELHHIYWYIDYITGQRIQNIGKIYQKFDNKKEKKKKATSGEKKLVPIDPPHDVRVVRVLLELDMLLTRASCRFLHALLMGCNERGVDNLFDDGTIPNIIPSSRFERRFQPFYSVAQPPAVRFESYHMHLRNMMNEQITPAGLLNAATEHYTAAKKLLEQTIIHMESVLTETQIEKLKGLMKVIQGNMISVMLVSMKASQGGALSLPQCDFSFSNQFPVIKLSK